MHIQKIEIRNIKSIKEFDMAFDVSKEAGWHVLIGDNGSGKSTVLQAIALVLTGINNIFGLNMVWAQWVREIDPAKLEARRRYKHYIRLYPIYNDHYDEINNENDEPYRGLEWFNEEKITNTGSTTTSQFFDLSGNDEKGLFSVAYGPYRRFTGGSPEYDSIFANNPKLAAHLSVFREDAALSEVVKWLQDLRFQELEAREKGQTDDFFLDKLRYFVNHDEFLPYGVHLKTISSSGVFFSDANGNNITLQNLSDGYRSILSMTFDIIRHMQIAYQSDDLFSEDFKTIKMPGVVLIDEVDAHLHPTWQRKIGPWFRQHFPNVQFIVTTHSPLICQAAAEGGSVWKLPRPGTDETCVRVTGQELNRLLYGNILEAYSTQLFGLTETRSEEGKEKLERLAHLNVQEVFQGLTDEEKKEQEELRSTMPTASNTIEGNS